MVSNNFSKDRSFHLTETYTHKKGNILRKNPLPVSLFTYYSLKIIFVPFLKSWPATIPCKSKTIKWATKLLIKKKGKGKKRERERTIEIDSQETTKKNA